MSKEIMYERIYKDLLTKIMKQEYLPGDKLPTEKELTDEYHVSRITAKKAMDMLAYKEFINDVQLYVCGYGCRKGSDHRGAGTRGVRHYTDVRAE